MSRIKNKGEKKKRNRKNKIQKVQEIYSKKSGEFQLLEMSEN